MTKYYYEDLNIYIDTQQIVYLDHKTQLKYMSRILYTIRIYIYLFVYTKKACYMFDKMSQGDGVRLMQLYFCCCISEITKEKNYKNTYEKNYIYT